MQWKVLETKCCLKDCHSAEMPELVINELFGKLVQNQNNKFVKLTFAIEITKRKHFFHLPYPEN